MSAKANRTGVVEPLFREWGTVSFDGKTIRSIDKVGNYVKPLPIVSAPIAELGITFGQEANYEKRNKIPAICELNGLLNLESCMVVADTLNGQKETAKTIMDADADYLLSAKDNQETLKQEIEDYVQDDDLRKMMHSASTREKNSGKIEYRKTFVTDDLDWLFGKEKWTHLACGAINTHYPKWNNKRVALQHFQLEPNSGRIA